MGQMIDALNTEEPEAAVAKFSMITFVFSVFVAICSFINQYAWNQISSLIEIKVRSILFKYFMTQDITFFDTHTIGDMIMLLNDDAKKISSSFDSTKVWQLRAIGQIISAFFTTLLIDWRISIILLVVVVLIAFITQLFRKLAQMHTAPRMKWNSKMITLADEAISNIRVVTVFNRQQKECERYHNAVDQASHHEAVANLYTSISRSLIELVGRCLMAVYSDFGAISILNKDVTPGDVLAVVRALYTGSFGISNVLQQSMREERSLESADKIFDYIAKPPEVVLDSGISAHEWKSSVRIEVTKRIVWE
jgi:subfamily B ATP-binding cassette protein MsbA